MIAVTKKTGFKVWHFSGGLERVYNVGMDLCEGSWLLSLTEVIKKPITTTTL